MFKTFGAAAALAITGAFVAPISAAQAQGVVANAPDPYVHKGVAVAFPKQAGEFERFKVTEFNAEGTDVGVGYSLTDLPGEITLYLYPVREASCQEEFDGAKTAIEQRNGKLSRNAEDLVIPDLPGATQKSAQFSVKANGYGFEHPKLVSFLWLGCMADGKWLAKYRGSFFERDADKLEGLPQRLFSQIDWSALIGE